MKNNNYSFFSVIKECLYTIADVNDDQKCYKIVIKKLNEFFKKNNSISFSFKKNIKEYAVNMLNIENQDILKIDLNDSVVDVKEHLDALKNTLKVIGENEKYDEEKIKNFLKQYSECSSNLIFNRDNYNLNLSLFRRCKLVKNLNELGVIPTNNKNVSYCSIYNPNTAYAIVEIINEIIKNRKKLSIDPALREIRYTVFINSQKDRFERFLATNYGDENMNKVFFKDNINEVVSMPINRMSSFKSIEPILLIDKIKSHIIEIKKNKQNLKDNFLNLNICIVGSVENSTQMNNLLESIIGWYNRNFDNPKLNLSITSVINKDDPFQDVENINKNINGNVANFNVTKYNFIDLYLSTNNIINLLSENDITFLLNCPFLSIHASDTGRYALYEVYKYPVDLVSKHYTGLIFKDDTIKGTIRYMNNNYIRKLVSKLESDEDDSKKLYIYTPEKFHETGMSYLGGFPISKSEIYDSNNFLINKFSNKNETKLEYKELSNINIKVNLWSLFKYISTEYLFNNIKDIIVKNINRDLSFDQSMEIFNNIYFEIKYNSLDLKFTEKFDNLLLKELNINDKKLNSIRKSMHKELSIIFKPLFDNCLFSNNEIDRSIKYSFFSALYDNAQDVISMYFVHDYIYSFKKNHYTHRNTKYNDEYVKDNLDIDNNYTCESFHDKFNYDCLMNQLETKDELNIGTIAMCNSSEKKVNKPNILKTNLENIIRLGEDYGCDDLQKNAEKAITRI